MLSVVSGNITLLGAMPKILLYVPFWYLRIDGRNREVTLNMSLMAGINITLDYLFLFTFEIGIFGAALASVIATVIAVLTGFFILYDSKRGFRFGICFKSKKKKWLLIAKNGSPAASDTMVWNTILSVTDKQWKKSTSASA